MEHKTQRWWLNASILALPVVMFVITLSIGRYPVSIPELGSALHAELTGSELTAPQLALVRVRLPRILISMMIGASLAMSGAVFQGLFQNPIASPNILGATSGASFGAALAIMLSLGVAGIQSFAFLGGLAAVVIVALTNRLIGKNTQSIATLILCGMLVSSIFSSLVSLLKYVADTETQLPAITFWLMGSLAGSTLSDLYIFWIFLPVTALLMAVRWKVNILSFGGEEAEALGVNVRVYRWIIIGCATMLTSMSVSVAGNIGWVGLVVPHLTRMLVGPNYGRLLPASMLIGASFMLLVDTFARLLFTVEVPLGILTALIGAPFFFILLLHSRRRAVL